MHETDKHKLEGLLKARSDGLRQGRAPRNRQPLAAAAVRVGGGERDNGRVSGADRPCADCGESIDALRLRAMPRATRCLSCQRTAERAAARS